MYYATRTYNKKNILLTVALLLAASALSSCITTGNYGSMQVDYGVTQIFDRGEILPDHNYYFSGSFAEPLAILAINKNIDFDKGLWNQVQISENLMYRWKTEIQDQYRYRDRYYAWDLYDPEGKKIGYWYSPLDWTVIEQTGEGKVTVYTPNRTNSPHLFRSRFLDK